MERKKHWEHIYNTKSLDEVSWCQPTPHTSLNLIANSNVSKDAAIIDVGGGDSFLVDHLLTQGYTNITVLDISANAIARAKKRLGSKSKTVKWIVGDITEFEPTEVYAVWHDRAVFHFLTTDNDIKRYKTVLKKSMHQEGQLIVGTFSETGPDKCSGINIKKYSEESLAAVFSHTFETITLHSETHETPFNTTQNFSFAHLKQKQL